MHLSVRVRSSSFTGSATGPRQASRMTARAAGASWRRSPSRRTGTPGACTAAASRREVAPAQRLVRAL